MVSAERAVSRVLAWGGVLGLALMLAGSVADGVYGDQLGRADCGPGRAHDCAPRSPAPVVAIRDGLSRWPIDPGAIGALGVLVLVLTPVAGLAVAIPCLWRSGDVRYAVIAAIVLAAVLLSFLLGGQTV